MTRKLVSVQKIVSTEPIPGADRIEIARVLGWQCVTQKSNNFKPGELVAYFEVDSLVPLDVPQFAFLRKKETDTHARIKTIKLKGHFAQGLILPLNIINEVVKSKTGWTHDIVYLEGDDLTEALGVEKWEPPIPAQLAGKVVGLFPGFVSKTDETRLQAIPSVLEKYKGTTFVVTEKLDGSSITVFYVPKDTPGLPAKYLESPEENIFGVASRNLCISYDEENAYWKAVKALNLEETMRRIGKPMVFQGELIGPGVQKNKLKQDELSIRWFNAIDPITRKAYNHNTARELFNEYGITGVPVLGNVVLNHTVDQLVLSSIGNSMLAPTVSREGIVMRPLEELEDEKVGRLSFKVINPEFSIKFDE